MADMDNELKQTLILASTTITLEKLCKLLIEKNVITKEEYNRITENANSIVRIALGEIENGLSAIKKRETEENGT